MKSVFDSLYSKNQTHFLYYTFALWYFETSFTPIWLINIGGPIVGPGEFI